MRVIIHLTLSNLQRVGKIISNSKLELKRGPRHTAKNSELPQKGKFLLECVVLRCAEEEKLGDRNES